MHCLLEQLTQLKHQGQVQGEDGLKLLSDLIEQALALRLAHPMLQGQALALHYTDLHVFVTALIAFDGWCHSLYLCPVNDKLELPPTVIRWPAAGNSTPPLLSIAGEMNHTHWYMSTSGTSGQPKWFEHTFSSLTSSIKTGKHMQALCWGLMYQPFRFAGLQVLLQALLSGANVVYSPAGDTLQQVALLRKYGVTAVSATPSMWRQLMMTGDLSQVGLRNVTLGGEIVDQALLDGLKAYFPQAKVRHIYASTEAGVGFVVADGMAGFPAKWLDVGETKLTIKVDKDQHLWIKPVGKVSAGLQDRVDEQGYIDTQDRVRLDGERVFFLGRVSGVINVGGNKVHPEHVEQVLLQVSGIKQARAYGKTSHIVGQLVVADVVIDSSFDPKTVKGDLLMACKQQLQRHEIPSKINFVEAITYNASGKMSRETKHV